MVRLEGGERRQRGIGPRLGPEGFHFQARLHGAPPCVRIMPSPLQKVYQGPWAPGGCVRWAPCQTWREGPWALALDHTEKDVIHLGRLVHLVVLVLTCPWALACSSCDGMRRKNGSQELACFCACALLPMCACGEEGGKAKTVQQPVAARVCVIFLVFVVSVPSCFARVVGSCDWT